MASLEWRISPRNQVSVESVCSVEQRQVSLESPASKQRAMVECLAQILSSARQDSKASEAPYLNLAADVLAQHLLSGENYVDAHLATKH